MNTILFFLSTYTTLWTLVFVLLSFFSNHRFLKTFEQKIIFFSFLFYLTIPTSLGAYLLYVAPNSAVQVDSITSHFFLIIISFYIVSTALELLKGKQADWRLILHHFVFAAMTLALIINGNFPMIWAALMTVQVSALAVYPKLILKKADLLTSGVAAFFTRLDFWMFLVVRVFFQTTLMVYFSEVEMFQASSAHPVFYPVILPTGIVSLYLNLFWFKGALRKYKQLAPQALAA